MEDSVIIDGAGQLAVVNVVNVAVVKVVHVMLIEACDIYGNSIFSEMALNQTKW